MVTLLARLIGDEGAQDFAEYGIALAIIAVAAGAIAVSVAADIGTLWTNAQTAIHSAL